MVDPYVKIRLNDMVHAMQSGQQALGKAAMADIISNLGGNPFVLDLMPMNECLLYTIILVLARAT